ENAALHPLHIWAFVRATRDPIAPAVERMRQLCIKVALVQFVLNQSACGLGAASHAEGKQQALSLAQSYLSNNSGMPLVFILNDHHRERREQMGPYDCQGCVLVAARNECPHIIGDQRHFAARACIIRCHFESYLNSHLTMSTLYNAH